MHRSFRVRRRRLVHSSQQGGARDFIAGSRYCKTGHHILPRHCRRTNISTSGSALWDRKIFHSLPTLYHG